MSKSPSPLADKNVDLTCLYSQRLTPALKQADMGIADAAVLWPCLTSEGADVCIAMSAKTALKLGALICRILTFTLTST